MTGISGGRQSGAFSGWLRTGKLPPVPGSCDVELKFNPWHDPTDGRFTFAGAGRRYGGGGDAVASAAGRGGSSKADRSPAFTNPANSQNATSPKVEAARAGSSASGRRSARYDASSTKPRDIARTPPGDQPNPVGEFFGGVGEGLSDVGKGAVEGIRSALTTSPATIVRDAAGGGCEHDRCRDLRGGYACSHPGFARCKRGGQCLSAGRWSFYRIGRWKCRTGGSAGSNALQSCSIAPTSRGKAAQDFRPSADRLGQGNHEVQETLESL